MQLKDIIVFYNPKNYLDLINNLSFYLRKIETNLNNTYGFRNKCSIQSLRITIKLCSDINKRPYRAKLIFSILEKYHTYWI